jgi:pimeloyl-ACP methyl ester carboxylesterase
VRPELRRSRRASVFSGTLIARKESPILGLNEIVKYLVNLDATLTPQTGLQQWTPQGLVPNAQPVQAGRILLFVHGTFGKSAHLFEEIQQAPGDPALLNRATTKPAAYNQILAFDHPTLSVSPIVDAIDLRTAFALSKAEVDIVCHSRGGLVSRWWMEVLDSFPARIRRAVFVGSPLTGTSLAAPDRLREGLKALSIYCQSAWQCSHGRSALECARGSARHIRLTHARFRQCTAHRCRRGDDSGTERTIARRKLFGAHAPNSPSGAYPAQYYFVSSNFQPERIGWNVLKGIRQIVVRGANALADNFVFRATMTW